MSILTADERTTLTAALETGVVVLGPFTAPMAASLEKKHLGYWYRASLGWPGRFSINAKGRAALQEEDT